MAKTLIFYGTMTGNTQSVAEQIKSTVIDADLINVTDLKPSKLSEYDFIIAGSSTWDDGELQYDMAEFIEKLDSAKPNFSNKKFAIFALGEQSYDKFCAAGDILKNKFTNWGGEVVLEILRIDGMPEEDSNQQALTIWTKKLVEKL